MALQILSSVIKVKQPVKYSFVLEEGDIVGRHKGEKKIRVRKINDQDQGRLNFYKQYNRKNEECLGMQYLAKIKDNEDLFLYGSVYLGPRENESDHDIEENFNGSYNALREDLLLDGMYRGFGDVKKVFIGQSEVRAYKYVDKDGNYMGEFFLIIPFESDYSTILFTEKTNLIDSDGNCDHSFDPEVRKVVFEYINYCFR